MNHLRLSSCSARAMAYLLLSLALLVAAGLACNSIPQFIHSLGAPTRATAAATNIVPASPYPNIPPTPLRETPARAQPAPPAGKRLVGYFTSWSIYARGYHASSIPAGLLTHVNYAYAIISNEGNCIPGDAKADATNMPELQALRQADPSLRLLISIGGRGTKEQFSQAASSTASRQQLARSCIQFMQQNGFDGIDVDWEFPASQEKSAYSALLSEFRRQMDVLPPPRGGEHYLLTIAAGASPYQYNNLPLQGSDSITSYLDWINLMTYDFHGPWSTQVNFNAPLHALPDDPAPSSLERTTFNIDSAVQAYLSAGVPAEKLVLGVPFYGYGWEKVPLGDPSRPGLFQTPGGPAPGTWSEGGVFDYKDLVDHYLIDGSGYTRYWNSDAAVPWLYNPGTETWISYDDPQSLAAKAAYAHTWGLGGMMVWQLSTDDDKNSLLYSLYHSLNEP